MKKQTLIVGFCVLFLLSLSITLEAEQQTGKKNEMIIYNQIEPSNSFADLSYYPNFHNFSNIYEGIVDNTTFEIWNSGCCGLTYNIIEECDWIHVHPTQGHSYGEKDTITVTINTTGLSIGNYRCDIIIDTSAGDGVFIVKLNVIPPPNDPPLKPYINGPQSGKCGEVLEFSAVTSDPNNDMLSYQWDFDNGSFSKWIGLYESDEACIQTHIWNEEDTYSIRVRARDEHGLESGWSDRLTIEMPKTKSIVQPFNYFLNWLHSLLYFT